MAEHVVCRVDDIADGKSKQVELEGRDIAIFRLGDRFAAITNRCPHEGGSLCYGRVAGLVESTGPGEYIVDDERLMVRCPWHGWEFDLKTGRSYCDPNRLRVRSFEVKVAEGSALAEGPYQIEVFEVSTRDSYVVLKI